MARGKKKEGIKRIRPKDFELFEGCRKTGLTSKQTARKIGISENRLRNLEKEGYIQSNQVVINKGKDTITIYKLDNKGKTWLKNNTDHEGFFYRTNEKQIEHDLKLSEIYYKLDPETRATWKNEEQLINNFKEQFPNHKRTGMIDATVTKNGKKIGIEVITKNYKDEEIAGKMRMAEIMGCEEVIKFEV